MTFPCGRIMAWVCGGTLMLFPSACTRLPSGPVEGFRPPVRGVALVDWTADGYAQAAARAAIGDIAAAGANTLVIVMTAYQPDAGGQPDGGDPRTPTPDAVGSAMAEAQARGLAVVLKPHVDLDDGAWRGSISPANAGAWFAAYRAFVLPWARLADSLGAVQFVVGTELAGTLDARSHWHTTIGAIRTEFAGSLTYAASWDEAERVPFWTQLDVVGVDFYFPVTRRTDAGRLEMLAGWAPWLERLKRLSGRTGRRILLTEVGYRSVDGAGMHPYAFDANGTPDPGEQADLYWAALEAVSEQDWIEGVHWWNWLATGAGGPADTDYTPSGKPAALELAGAWTR